MQGPDGVIQVFLHIMSLEVDNIESSRNVLRMPKSVISTETCVSHPLARAIVFYWASY